MPAFAGMTWGAFAGMTWGAFAGMTRGAVGGMTRGAFAGMTWRAAVPRYILGSATPRWRMYLPALSA